MFFVVATNKSRTTEGGRKKNQKREQALVRSRHSAYADSLVVQHSGPRGHHVDARAVVLGRMVGHCVVLAGLWRGGCAVSDLLGEGIEELLQGSTRRADVNWVRREGGVSVGARGGRARDCGG